MLMITGLLSLFLIGLSNYAAFGMGHSRGCIDMLKRLRQLNQDFELRHSDDMNFNKVKKEFFQYLESVHPDKLPTPSLWSHILNQKEWRNL